MADYKITLLKGDGIGPEIVNQAVKVLDCAAEKFGFGVTYDEALLGGCAIDASFKNFLPHPAPAQLLCRPLLSKKKNDITISIFLIKSYTFY